MSNADENTRVSVALCTFNGADYIAAQVESILRQDHPADEIVLSDDASSDDTVAIVERIVADWVGPRPRLLVIRNASPLGVIANFEQATTACTGDLIALCDQDDVWRRDKLALFVALFNSRPGLPFAHSDATLVTEDLEPLKHSLLQSLEISAKERQELVDGRSYRAFIRRNLATGATAVFRRSLLEYAIPFPEEWIHDEWLAIIAASLSSTMLIDDELVDYRQHDNNQIGAQKPDLRYKFRKLIEPREERNAHLVDRASVLVERLELLGPAVRRERLQFARRNLAHELMRLGLPRHRLLRVPSIAGGYLSGRYTTFSRGLIDVARDLVQPAS
jgi:glycosyltransferase involved in cell wall biosynthesis